MEQAPGQPPAEPGLRVAAVLAAGQALALLGIAAAEAFAVSGDRIGLGVSTTVFFVVCSVGLAYVASGLWRALGWSRGPLVVAELLFLGLAVSLRDSRGWVALGVALVAVAVLLLVLRPAATRAMSL